MPPMHKHVDYLAAVWRYDISLTKTILVKLVEFKLVGFRIEQPTGRAMSSCVMCTTVTVGKAEVHVCLPVVMQDTSSF
jgi:hypothetical protein